MAGSVRKGAKRAVQFRGVVAPSAREPAACARIQLDRRKRLLAAARTATSCVVVDEAGGPLPPCFRQTIMLRTSSVMAGLVPATHAHPRRSCSWMAGTRLRFASAWQVRTPGAPEPLAKAAGPAKTTGVPPLDFSKNNSSAIVPLDQRLKGGAAQLMEVVIPGGRAGGLRGRPCGWGGR
jgi:hypothetical protein